MFELLQPFLLGGLAATSVPVLIHLWRRRQFKRVHWGAMRFLAEVMARRRRRLFLEELLLMLIRVLILGAIALAMARPAWRPRVAGGAARQGGVAAVLLVDDSLSSMAGRAQPAIEGMKRLAAAYLDSLAPGDEVSLIPMSQAALPAADPEFDLESVKARLAALPSRHAATDIPALLDAGLNQLKRHLNPSAELVLLTDGRGDGWRADDRARWEGLRQRLRGPADAPVGSRRRPRVITLAPEVESAEANVAVGAIQLDRTLATAGRPAGILVRVDNHGNEAITAVSVAASVNGEAIGKAQVDLPPNTGRQVSFTHTFPTPGSYSVEAAVTDHQDLLPADDRRSLAVEVEPPLPVLLVEGESGRGYDSKLGFLQTALDPDGDGRGPFLVSRVLAAQLAPAMFETNRVVILADVRALEPSLTDAIERFVVKGGGLLAGLGPASDPAFLNRHWARDGEGLLPCPVADQSAPERPALPAAPAPGHPVFAGFGSQADEAWKEARVRRYFRLDPRRSTLPEFETVLSLDNGDPLLVERRRGLGLAALWTSSLNAEWNDLPAQAAYVPLMRALVGRLGSFIVPSRNLSPGDRLVEPRADLADEPFEGRDPDGRPLPLEWGVWEGRGALLSGPLDLPGVYTLRLKTDANGGRAIRYAVAPSPAESGLSPLRTRDFEDAFEGGATLLRRPEAVAPTLEPGRREGVEVWRWLAAAALGLMFLEATVSRRDSAASRTAPTGGMP